MGTHFAVCDMVVDLGKQRTSYQGEESVKHQIYLRWQIPAERVEWKDGDGNQKEGPAVIGKTYTLSLGEKANLRKDLQAWRGKSFTEEELRGFDVAKLLGVPATLTVTHTEKNGRTYTNVASLGGIPKGMDKPSAENGVTLYDNDNAGTFENLPKWLREKITAQIDPGKVEDEGAGPRPFADDDLDDDVPF
ncbi:hypothetical protein CDQ92_13360 [Sphingopyxis bauzanensis]|uniref:Uncharacterized protein n=2 Tax=Sphingopyxis bauzanensis TaxID=651663 RepID=A0A246JRX3_9SPHN|nr:hypothetical protein CDQ92_13360 [Sphingopyxis bauzanensis]